MIAQTILQQLGGTGRLHAMTGAYNFLDLGDGVSFRIKNARANYIRIKLNSLDLYDVEVGRIRGHNYTVVKEMSNLYADQMKEFIEGATGMRLSFAGGGGVADKGLNMFLTNYDDGGFLVFIYGKNAEYNQIQVQSFYGTGKHSKKVGITQFVSSNQMTKINSGLVINTYRVIKYKGQFIPKQSKNFTHEDFVKSLVDVGFVVRYFQFDKTALQQGIYKHLFTIEKEGVKMNLEVISSFFGGNIYKVLKDKNGNVVLEMTESSQSEDFTTSAQNIKRAFENHNTGYYLGQTKFKEEFDYKGMLRVALKTNADWKLSKLNALYNSFESVKSDKYNNLSENLWLAIKNLEEGKKQEAEGHLEKFHDAVIDEMLENGYLKRGGRVRFVDKVKAIADRLEGTKVPKRLKKDYGGRYNREEAEEAGRRIAGAYLRDRKIK